MKILLLYLLLILIYLLYNLYNYIYKPISTFKVSTQTINSAYKSVLPNKPIPSRVNKIMYPNIHKSILDCSNKFDLEQVYEYDNFITPELCDKIIEMGKPLLKRSGVLSKEEPIDKQRTSTNTFLKINDDIKIIDEQINNLLGIPIEFYEELQVVNYKHGQLYSPHYDACGIKDYYCIEEFNKLGGNNRYATFIIYLNDNMTGGETEFPKKNIEVAPKKGKAVLFFNLSDDYTDIRINSFHGGKPPDSGEKWMCNKWIRLGKV